MSDNTELNTFINSLSLDDYHQNFLYYILSDGKYFRKQIFDQFDNAHEHYDISWAIEILHVYFIITNDIISKRKLRNNKSSWHVLYPKNVLKDTLFLRTLIFKILSYHKDHLNYNRIVGLFCLTLTKTWIGQCLDSNKKEIKTIDDVREYYNFSKYKELLISKICHLTLILPINVGLMMKYRGPKSHYHEICEEISFLLQYQDDYFNCLPLQSGKISTYLDEKKVTWFLCKILENDCDYDTVINYILNNNKVAIKNLIKPLLDNYSEKEKSMIDGINEKIQTGDQIFRFIMGLISEKRSMN